VSQIPDAVGVGPPKEVEAPKGLDGSSRGSATTPTKANSSAALPAADAAALAECETVIERGLQTFVEVGNALLAIRDQRLYRQGHGTFEAYCRDRWRFTATRARQLISASEIATIVAVDGGHAPGTESQTRELAGLAPHQAAIVMRVAHENSGGRMTTAAIGAARCQPWTKAEITVAVDGYRIHPLLACLPAFRPIEWDGFPESIQKYLIHPITLSPDGTTIVDGRFRYLALRWNGINPATATTFNGQPALRRLGQHYDECKILDYIRSLNIVRTHLTDGQRAMILVNIEAATG
jgi:hypothetical protein